MGKWLAFQLALGKVGTRQLVHADQIKRTHRPHAWPEGVVDYPDVMYGAYGLGWVVDQYRGYHRINHGGGISGFTAFTSFLPNAGLGVAVMVNCPGSGVPGIVTKLIYDRLLGLEKTDWIARAQHELRQQRRQGGKPASPASPTPRHRGTRPSHDLAAYVGCFTPPGGCEAARRGAG
jgi:CubicO group peptidase (beta-lactamase class C family)